MPCNFFSINRHTLWEKKLIMAWIMLSLSSHMKCFSEDWEDDFPWSKRGRPCPVWPKDVPQPGWPCLQTWLLEISSSCWLPSFLGQLWPRITISSALCSCANLYLDSWSFQSHILGSFVSPLAYAQCRDSRVLREGMYRVLAQIPGFPWLCFGPLYCVMSFCWLCPPKPLCYTS